jgi:hypothetical protein
MGQYPFAALVGKVIDGYGPWACSLIASVLFSTGFGLFAAEVAKTPDDIAQPSKSSFRILAACFFLTGLGTASSYVSTLPISTPPHAHKSYFSSIFAASKTFPQYPGAASGASMAFFGLSPLFLSLLASTYFTDPTTGLDVTRFLMFLAIASGIVHVIGAFTLRIPTSQCGVASQPDSVVSGRDEESSIDERQPLLPQKAPRSGGQAVRADEGSVLHLFRDPYFWSLAFIILIITGSVSPFCYANLVFLIKHIQCEMIISNIGTIVLSLYPNSVAGIKSLSSSAETVTTTQVRLISISNTLSRLISGPLADIISPLISHKPGDGPSPPRKYRISRVVLLSGTSLLLAGAFVYLELAIKTPGDLWILRYAALILPCLHFVQ